MTPHTNRRKAGDRPKQKLAIVTVARSDFGIYLPLAKKLAASDWAQPLIIAGAAHLSDRHGRTVDWIMREGFAIDARVPMTDDTDDAVGVAAACAEATIGFANAYQALQPDAIIVLGDRFEMHAAAVAAIPFGIPIIHLHGGEITQGAIDESYRHSITKLSHIHFASTQSYADRIVQMGESPERVFVSGAPGLDHLNDFIPWSIAELAEKLEMNLGQSPLSITFHPETLCDRDSVEQVTPLLEVLAGLDCPMVISQPNADPGNEAILDCWQAFADERPDQVRLTANLGTQGYFSLLHHAAAMVGNSSSGIIEAASFGLPVVNIGDRQKGRIRGRNVIDTGFAQDEIRDAIDRATSPAFRDSLKETPNPYGDGNASDRIVQTLRQLMQERVSVRKPFHDAVAKPSQHEIQLSPMKPTELNSTHALIGIGAGGHARVMIALAERCGFAMECLLEQESAPAVNANLDQVPIVYQSEADFVKARTGPVAAAICVGTADSTRVRRRLYHQLIQLGYTLPSLIDPSTVREHSVSVGSGVHVLSGSTLAAGASLGDNVLINHRVLVEHDCEIGDHSHIACGSILCGGVRIGEGTLVGAGSVILPGLTIGKNCVIGAGSTVTRDVPEGQTYAGNPARPLLQSKAA